MTGEERAGDIIINAVLPFYAAYAREISKSALEEKAFGIYRQIPAAAENSLEKHMRRQLGLPPGTAATARRRQGLLYIYKTLCTQGKCDICPLNRMQG